MAHDRVAASARIGTARSFLFVPGNRPERFDKAMASDADIVILDLEDAVPSAEKAAARQAVAAWLDPGRPALVRINAADTQWFEDDCTLFAMPGLLGVMLPKAEPSDILNHVADRVPTLALVESATGMAGVGVVAATPGIVRLALGAIDLALDLDMSADDRLFDPLRLHMTIASRAATIASPVDGVCTELHDGGIVTASMRQARALGFGAKLCIHPRQVASVHDALMPSHEELAWARRVLDADAKAQGAAVAVDGMMIDRPVVQRAMRMMQRTGVA